MSHLGITSLSGCLLYRGMVLALRGECEKSERANGVGVESSSEKLVKPSQGKHSEPARVESVESGLTEARELHES